MRSTSSHLTIMRSTGSHLNDRLLPEEEASYLSLTIQPAQSEVLLQQIVDIKDVLKILNNLKKASYNDVALDVANNPLRVTSSYFTCVSRTKTATGLVMLISGVLILTNVPDKEVAIILGCICIGLSLCLFKDKLKEISLCGKKINTETLVRNLLITEQSHQVFTLLDKLNIHYSDQNIFTVIQQLKTVLYRLEKGPEVKTIFCMGSHYSFKGDAPTFPIHSAFFNDELYAKPLCDLIFQFAGFSEIPPVKKMTRNKTDRINKLLSGTFFQRLIDSGEEINEGKVIAVKEVSNISMQYL